MQAKEKINRREPDGFLELRAAAPFSMVNVEEDVQKVTLKRGCLACAKMMREQ